LLHEHKRLLAAIYHVSLREQIGPQHNAMLSCNAFRCATLSLHIVYSWFSATLALVTSSLYLLPQH